MAKELTSVCSKPADHLPLPIHIHVDVIAAEFLTARTSRLNDPTSPLRSYGD
jgi:hypothetical protein